MSRGNQRDTDRARAHKRAEKHGQKSKDKDGLTPAQRKERDAKALQDKEKPRSRTGSHGVVQQLQQACLWGTGFMLNGRHATMRGVVGRVCDWAVLCGSCTLKSN
eukprot:jgi/Chrzof1/4977/Cz15g07060.t1